MTLVARKIADESWRDAIARRAGTASRRDEALATFDSLVAGGRPEHEAAFLALREIDCLDKVTLSGVPDQAPSEAQRDQIEPPGS